MWLMLKNKTAIGDNLLKHAEHGPFWCYLCKCNNEIVDHLFLEFQAAKDLWSLSSSFLTTLNRWQGESFHEAWINWWASAAPPKSRNLPLIICWALWVARNNLIFQNISPHWPSILARIMHDYNTILDEEVIHWPRSIVPESINHLLP